MAAVTGSHRAVAVGISGGLGLAVPLAAYLATIPFEGAHEAVAADVLPFAAGAIAGVGLLTLSSALLDARERRQATVGADGQARAFGGSDAASTHVGTAAPKGVPVINRAVDAMDEDAAWAEIDAMFTDGSPFSCDPARSKDMYQIAFEELQRTAAGASAASRPQAVRPDSTAMYAAMAGTGAAAVRTAAPATGVGGAAAPAAATATAAAPVDGDAKDAQAARDAAMAALYGPSPLASAGRPASGSAAAPASNAAAAAAAPSPSAPAAEEPQSVEVPMADYSGHEDMWEAALAILDEPAEPRTSPAATSFVSAERMAALAAGGAATTMHDHVNGMLEEELDRSCSGSVRGATHEFLRVVQGGTASMPRMTAEA